MRALLLCMFKACLLLMRLPWPGGLFVRSATYFWPLMAWTGFWAFILCGLLPSKVGPYLIVGFSLFGSLLCSFRKLASIPAMPLCYSCCGVIWPVLARPFLDLLYAFLSLDYSDQHCHWVCIHATWASLTYSIAYELPRSISSSLSILGPFSFIGHPWPIPILHFHELLLTLLSFLGPITISFTFGVHGLSINPLFTYFVTLGLSRPILAFILPMSLLLLSLGSFRPVCFI